LRGIDQFKDPQARKVAEEGSITIRRKTLFNNTLPEDVDVMAAAAWTMACGLWTFNDSVPQQLALDHMAYASPLDFV